jgi:4-hydroxybenzoate polyprenyltransferase/phosphoserine phosphatase
MADAPVLVVDLDGTLIRSDLLDESFWSAVGRAWWTPIAALSPARAGRAAVKRWLGARARIDPSLLPYDPLVLDLIAERRAAGGRVVLVTAADQALAERVAGHLGLFDDVRGSDGTTNLKGAEKAAYLIARFGPKGFDYIGDSRRDLPVWAAADGAMTLHAAPGLRALAEAANPAVRHLGEGGLPWRALLAAMRPLQWLKNLLVFVPMLAAHDLTPPTVLATTLAFVAFCLSASAVYVLNDLLDLAADRVHPRKRLRPFASGALPIRSGLWLVPGLALAALSLGTLLGWRFVAVLLVYQLATTVYSLVLKRRAIIDIGALACLYSLRIFAGAVATGIVPSIWLLAFSTFFFFALAAVKRLAELTDLQALGRRTAAGRAYRVEDLPLIAGMALSSGYVSVLVMALYIHSPEVQELYTHPLWLWGVCPVLLYWISRTVLLTHRGAMKDDPVVFALSDRASRACLLVILACVLAGSLL